MKRIRYVFPNLITFVALLCGIYSIKLSIEGSFVSASWFIIYSILLDKLDGTLAKMLKAQSRFGNYFDSISDLVDFGIAPGLLAYFLFASIAHSFSIIVFAAYSIFTLASLWRLIKYSLYESKNKDFKGIPTTMSGGIISSYVLVVSKYNLAPFFVLILPIILIVLGFLMNGRFEFAKIRKRGKKFNIFQAVVAILIYVLVIFRAFPEILFTIAFLYLVIGLTISAFK